MLKPAVVADGLQLLLGPLGWLFVDEIIDVAAMGLSCALIGFHWLLLPTFVVEFVPVADMLPTWTGCVSTVLVLRRKARRACICAAMTPWSLTAAGWICPSCWTAAEPITSR